MTKETEVPEHLQLTTPGRGFKQYPPINQMPYGMDAVTDPKDGNVQLVESSLAFKSSAYIFTKQPTNLNNPDGEFVEAAMLISMRDLKKFAEQCLDLCEKHYHMDCYGHYYFDDEEYSLDDK